MLYPGMVVRTVLLVLLAGCRGLLGIEEAQVGDPAAPSGPFTVPAVRLASDPAFNVSTPFLTDDCKVLYYTNLHDGRIRRVSHP